MACLLPCVIPSITQGVDTIIKKTSTYITCKSMWEYYGVYFDVDNASDLISGNAFGSAIVTDDEDASAIRCGAADAVVRRPHDEFAQFMHQTIRT